MKQCQWMDELTRSGRVDRIHNWGLALKLPIFNLIADLSHSIVSNLPVMRLRYVT